MTTLNALLTEIDALDRPGLPPPPAARQATPRTGDLLCVDGRTHIPMPPEVRAFYAYRNGWRLQSIDLEWPAPEAMPDLLVDRGVSETITADIDHGLIRLPGLRRDRVVLLAFDYLPTIFQRAYLVFHHETDYIVVDAGSEITSYPTLAAYLHFWREVLRCP